MRIRGKLPHQLNHLSLPALRKLKQEIGSAVCENRLVSGLTHARQCDALTRPAKPSCLRPFRASGGRSVASIQDARDEDESCRHSAHAVHAATAAKSPVSIGATSWRKDCRCAWAVKARFFGLTSKMSHDSR